jgi:Proteasome non-ATPase 26S subunit
MQVVNQCGLLPKFLGELDTDDVLTRLNCLELLSTIAVTAHGCSFLQQQGIMQKLDNFIGNMECDPFGELLLPGRK